METLHNVNFGTKSPTDLIEDIHNRLDDYFFEHSQHADDFGGLLMRVDDYDKFKAALAAARDILTERAAAQTRLIAETWVRELYSVIVAAEDYWDADVFGPAYQLIHKHKRRQARAKARAA